MAVAAADITEFGKSPVGNGFWQIWFKYTGPASYTSGGEALTKTVCKQACEGISEIEFLTAAPAGGSSYTTAALCTFEPTNTSTETGQFHFINTLDTHNHDFLLVGGQSAATHTHDIRVIGGQAVAGTDTVQAAAGDLILGKEEAGNALIAGVNEATKGGVVANSTSAAILMVGTDTIGKEEATNRTIAGADSATKGGVVAATAEGVCSEAAAATDFSSYTCWFYGLGRM